MVSVDEIEPNGTWNFHGIRVRWKDYSKNIREIKSYSFIKVDPSEYGMVRDRAKKFADKIQKKVDSDWLNNEVNKAGRVIIQKGRIELTTGLPTIKFVISSSQNVSKGRVYIQFLESDKIKKITIEGYKRSEIVKLWKEKVADYCAQEMLDPKTVWNRIVKKTKATKKDLHLFFDELFIQADISYGFMPELNTFLRLPPSAKGNISCGVGLEGLSIVNVYRRDVNRLSVILQIRSDQ